MVKVNKNSLLYWFPKIKNLGIPYPQTVYLVIEAGELIKLFNSKEDHKLFLKKHGKEIEEKADEIGFPLFMRTDQMACKHSWKHTCFVSIKDELFRNLYTLVEENFCKDMAGECEPNAIVFREFLELDWKFKAFDEMPIASEWRFFVDEKGVKCFHPYWPPNAIRRPSIPNWLELLKEMNEITPKDLRHLTDYGCRIGKTLGGYWSVDFCKTKTGIWTLTDMAMGEASYHWPTCPNAPTEMLKHYGDPEKIEEFSI